MYRLTLTNNSSPAVSEDSPIEMFLQDVDVKANSRDIYRRELKQFVEYLNKREILEVTKQTIIEYKEHLINEGKATMTITAYLLAIKALYKWMERNGICKDITIGVKLPRNNSNVQKKDALTPEQTVELLNSFNKNDTEEFRNYVIVNLMIHTGLRTIEIQRANIQDIGKVNDSWVLKVQGKGSISKDEIVVLTESAYKPLEQYIAIRNAKPADPLFVSISDRNNGSRLSTRTISLICKTALRRINLDSKRLSAHSLRHTSITLALLGGSSLEQVQKMSRHKDIKTLQVYAHHIDRIRQAPENSIDSILGKVA